MASASGAIDAAIATAEGKPVAHGEVSALKVNVKGEGEARHDVALAWDASRAVFHGMVAADARLASGPLDVSFALGGKTHTGRIELAVVLPQPRLGGRMMVVGHYSAEVVPKVDGEIEVDLRDAAGAAVQAAAGLRLTLRAQGGQRHARGRVALGCRARALRGAARGRRQARAGTDSSSRCVWARSAPRAESSWPRWSRRRHSAAA